MTRRVGSISWVLKTFVEGIPLDARTPRRKVSRWTQGQQETSLFIEDGVLYSYGHHYPVARWLSRHVLLLNGQYCSPTTEHHKSALLSMLTPDELVCPVHNVKADSPDEHLLNLDMLAKDLTSKAGQVLRSREYKRGRHRQLAQRLLERNEYAGFLVVTGQITRKQGRPLSQLNCYMTRR